MSFINEVFGSVLAAAARMGLAASDGSDPAFYRESDWRVGTQGRDRWLITFVYPETMRTGIAADWRQQPEGFLIGYETTFDRERRTSTRTGRVLLIAGPWNHFHNKVLEDEAAAAGVLGRVDRLVDWLRPRA